MAASLSPLKGDGSSLSFRRSGLIATEESGGADCITPARIPPRFAPSEGTSLSVASTAHKCVKIGEKAIPVERLRLFLRHGVRRRASPSTGSGRSRTDVKIERTTAETQAMIKS